MRFRRRTKAKQEVNTSSTPLGRRRHWLRWWCSGIGLILLLSMVMLPHMMAYQPIRHAIFDRMTHPLSWRLRCNEASFSWWSKIDLHEVRLLASDGQEIVTARRVTTQRSLIELCRASDQLGLIQIEAPHFQSRIRSDGSEWEDWLSELSGASFSTDAKKTTFPGPRFNLQIQEGTVDVVPEGLPAWKIDSFQALIGVRADGLQIDVKARVADGADWGTMHGSAVFPTDTSRDPVLQLQLQKMPLFILDTLALRSGQTIRARGSVAGKIKLTEGDQERSLQGQLGWHQLEIQAPQYLGSDTLKTDQLQTRFELAEDELEIDLRQLKLTSDLMDLDAHGKLVVEPGGSLWRTLETSHYTCQGRVNVAELSRQLVETLRRRTDTEVASGHVNWELTNRLEGSKRTVAGEITSRGLKIRGPNNRHEFVQPLEMRFLATVDADRWRLEELSGKSTFLEFRGKGDTQAGQLTARADLMALRSELSQFVDLGFLRLDGTVDGQLQWQTLPSGEMATQGKLNASDLMVAVSQRNWHEPSIDLTFDTVMQYSESDRREWKSGKLQMRAGGDRLDIRLTDAMPWQGNRWPLEVEVYGNLNHWRHRLRGVVEFPVPPIEGTIDTRLSLLREQNNFQLSVPAAEIRNFYLELPGVRLQEPRIRIEGGGRWNSEQSTLTLTESSFASTALALRVGSLSYNPQRGGFPNVQLSYRGDLERMWLAVPNRHRQQLPSGSFSGLLTLHEGSEGTQFSGQADFQNLRWLARNRRTVRGSEVRRDWQTIWHEPQLRLQTAGKVARELERIHFENLELDSTIADVQLQGEVHEPWGATSLRLQGRSSLNLDQISSRLAPTWGEQLRLVGHVTRPFEITGPLRPASPPVPNGRLLPVSTGTSQSTSWLSPQLQGEAGIGWQQIHAWGFDFEPGKMDLKLENQNVFVLPLELATRGGRIRITPRLRLDHPLRVDLEAGQVVEQVQITPQMCRGWLKFVAPLLADVTEAHGRFSVALDGATIPLASPATSQIRGTLQIHAAEVGPGATSQQILSVIQQIQTISRANRRQSSPSLSDWIIVPEQNVRFQMLDGKIYHEDLTLLIGNVPVKTRGWVDVDEQINLVARLPIQESWVGQDRWLAGLRGQTIEVPIRGTLKQPRVDHNFLNDLGQKVLRRSTESFLQEEVQKQLNRLFD